VSARCVGVTLALALSGCALFLPKPDDRVRLAEWQRRTVSLRQLEFKHGVELRWVSRDQMPDVLTFEAGAELEPARVARERDDLAALGALAPDVDLGKEMLALYASQAAGIYSATRNTLFVSDDMSSGLKTLLLDPIVVHELTHALQDQNFPQILDFLLGLENEDDVGRALSGTIEGDASVTMFGAFPGGEHADKLELAQRTRDAMLAELEDKDSEIGRAPRLLSVSLVFPYAYGTVIAAQRLAARGNAGLDQELLDPPLASLELLHPETRGTGIEFVRLPLDALRAHESLARCSAHEPNVAGALTLRVIFEATSKGPELDSLVSSWRGDRYALLDCDGKWELAWLTRWDSPQSAARFADAYRALAPGIAARTSLSGPAEVVVSGKTALVLTPQVRPFGDEILRSSEIRSYADFKAWVADRCFPESQCPTLASRVP
jgi:hypothetical protein